MARSVTVIPAKRTSAAGIRNSAGCEETKDGGVLQGYQPTKKNSY